MCDINLEDTITTTITTILWPFGFCQGIPGWAGTRKV